MEQNRPVKLYAVVTMGEYDERKDVPSRTVAICQSQRRAQQIVNRNEGDIHEEGHYPLVVIESIASDQVYGYSNMTRIWYRWNLEHGKYMRLTQSPRGYENTVAFWE